MKQTSKSLAEEYASFFEEAQGMLRTVSNQPSVRNVFAEGPGKDEQLLLTDITSNIPYFRQIMLVDPSGNVVEASTSDKKNLVGTSIAKEDFFNVVQQSKTDAIVVHDQVFKSGGDERLIVCLSQQIRDSSGKMSGWGILLLDWAGLASATLDSLRFGRDGYGFIYDKDGTIIAHAVSKGSLMTTGSQANYFKERESSQSGDSTYVFKGRAKIMVYHKIPTTGWIVILSAYEDDLATTALEQRNVMAIGGIFVIVLVVGLCLWLLRKLVFAPVNGVLAFASAVSDGDLKASLEGSYKYEFSVLASKIQVMVAELKNKLGFSDGVLRGMTIPCVIADPGGNVIWVNQPACDLCESRKGPDEWVGHAFGEFFYGDASHESITTDTLRTEKMHDQELSHSFPSGKQVVLHVNSLPFYDMDGKLLGAVTYMIDLTEIRQQQKKVEEQHAIIAKAAAEADSISQHLASASEELSAQVDEASRGTILQRDRMSEIATSMNEMTASVLEVARNASSASEVTTNARREAELGASNLNDLTHAIEEVQAQALSLKESMGELGVQAEGIGNVMNVISDIADQTNLLALNAAIEAARAGEAGRGFAVVADEVRKLAEKTMTATQEVGTAIGNIQQVAKVNIQSTEKAVTKIADSTELVTKSGEVLDTIVGMMENAAAQVSGIATAAEEQSLASEEINQSTGDVTDLSQKASEIMEQSAQAVQEVAEMAAKLSMVIEEMS